MKALIVTCFVPCFITCVSFLETWQVRTSLANAPWISLQLCSNSWYVPVHLLISYIKTIKFLKLLRTAMTLDYGIRSFERRKKM